MSWVWDFIRCNVGVHLQFDIGVKIIMPKCEFEAQNNILERNEMVTPLHFLGNFLTGIHMYAYMFVGYWIM